MYTTRRCALSFLSWLVLLTTKAESKACFNKCWACVDARMPCEKEEIKNAFQAQSVDATPVWSLVVSVNVWLERCGADDSTDVRVLSDRRSGGIKVLVDVAH